MQEHLWKFSPVGYPATLFEGTVDDALDTLMREVISNLEGFCEANVDTEPDEKFSVSAIYHALQDGKPVEVSLNMGANVIRIERVQEQGGE